MEKELFKPINFGVCSYFLMVYSCQQILLELWYSSYPFDLFSFFSFVSIILLLLIGIFAFVRYKRIRNNFSDNSIIIVAKAVNLIVGFIFVSMLLLQFILIIILSIRQPNQGFSLKSLFFLFILYSPIIIIAVLNIIRGFRARADLSVSKAITFLCFHVVLFYVLIFSIYKLLVWIGNTLVYTDFAGMSPIEVSGIYVQTLLIAVSLVLLFIPFHFKKYIKNNTDNKNCGNLRPLSYFISGWIVLIIGCIEALRILIRNLRYIISDFEEYSSEYFYRPILEILPVLILLTISIVFIVYGRKHLEDIWQITG